MAARFGATMNAINRGLENEKPNKGVQMIEDWEAALADAEVPGGKGLMRDLEALKKQLERPEADQQRIFTLLHRLGEATVKIAGRVDKGDKIRELGEALTEVGEPQADEEEDQEAKAAPKRRSTKKDGGNQSGNEGAKQEEAKK